MNPFEPGDDALPSSAIDDQVVSLAEVSRQSRLSSRTIRRWASQGLIPARWVAPGTWVFRRADVEAYLVRGSESGGRADGGLTVT